MKDRTITALFLAVFAAALLLLTGCGHFEKHVHHYTILDKMYQADTRHTDLGWSFGKHGGPMLVDSGGPEKFILLLKENYDDKPFTKEVDAAAYVQAKIGAQLDIETNDWISD